MKSCFSFLYIFLLFCVSTPALAYNGRIENVVYEKNEGNVESVVFHLNGPHLPKVFAMKGEQPRVVFDFYETVLDRKAPSRIEANGNVVKMVRLGRHTDKTRVVIDLTSSEGYRFEQKFDEINNSLTILLFPENASLDSNAAESVAVPEPTVTEVLSVDSIPAKNEVFPSSVPPKMSAEKTGPAEVMATVQEDSSAAGETGKSLPVETVQEKEKNTAVETSEKEVADPVLLDPLLTDVSFENTSNNGEMVLFKLNGFFPPTVSGEEKGTPRVVCTFAGTRLSEKIKKDQVINGKFVERIKVERVASSNQIQVALHLVPSKNYDLQQVFFKEDNLFVVIVNSFEPKESSQEKTSPEK